MSTKIIVLVPNPNLPGGVSHYYKTAKPYFSKNIRYVYFNSRYSKGFLKIIGNLLVIIKVLFLIIFYLPKRVVVNPSLGRTALLRDGLFLFWSRLFLRDTLVFWRGWNPEREYLFKSRFIEILFNATYKKSKKHIVLNAYIKQSLINLGVCEDCIFLSNTIVDDTYFNPIDFKKSTSKFTLLFLTRVEKYKGIYEVLDMFTQKT